MKTETDSLLVTAAPDLLKAIGRWQRHLSGEDRKSVG
jgi:hypothetical protein